MHKLLVLLLTLLGATPLLAEEPSQPESDNQVIQATTAPESGDC